MSHAASRARPALPNSSLVAPAAFGHRGDSLICFSHLRWNFVFQRPQHLMSRFAAARRVFVWEEPVPAEARAGASLDVSVDAATGVTVAVPRLPEGLAVEVADAELARLLETFRAEQRIAAPVAWFYTPMMLGFARPLLKEAACVVYDCMDELANFKGAPPALRERERELMAAADLVLTGGWSLYEAKRDQHADIHPFPSSVDRAHFAAARAALPQPPEQAATPAPRLGFYGVIDERLDIALLAALADAHPEWTLVMVGPVVKIDPASLPQRPNILYAGGKTYAELPAWLAGWDVALMPFAINEATRFISPTKTPEYLAGGRPVVSTAIVDVKRHYGELEAVIVADTHADFIRGCERALALRRSGLGRTGEPWLPAVDAALAELSWDATFARMSALVDEAVVRRERRASPAAPAVHAAGRASHFDAVVVGAGFAGATVAERLAAEAGKRVLVIDRRPHVAGNAFDVHDAAGVLIHQYGPHIFHTNSDEIVRHLSRFTAWRTYEHRVLASVDGRLVPDPDQPHDDERPLRPGPAQRRAGGELPGLARGARGTHPDLGGRGGRRRRPRALREVLPGLHAQAVGHRPLRPGQERHQPRADPHQHRRPLLHRQLPGHAQARFHPHVREHARPRQHHHRHLHGLRGRARRRAVRPAGVHGPGRRVLRLPLRQASLSLAALRAPDVRLRAAPAGGGGQLSAPRTCPTPASANTST